MTWLPGSKFEVRGIAAGMSGWLVISVGGAEYARWGWRGSATDADIGTLVLPNPSRVDLVRDPSIGEQDVHVHVSVSVGAAPDSESNLVVRRKTEVSVVIPKGTVHRRIVLPEGGAKIAGAGGEGRLLEQDLTIHGDCEIVLVAEPKGAATKIVFEGIREGMARLEDEAGALLTQGPIHDGAAVVRSDKLARASSVRVFSDMEGRWSRSVRMDYLPGQERVVVGGAPILLQGVVESGPTADCRVCIVGEGEGVKVEYFNDGLKVGEVWSVMVESGLDYSIHWGKASGGEREPERAREVRSVGMLRESAFVRL